MRFSQGVKKKEEAETQTFTFATFFHLDFPCR